MHGLTDVLTCRGNSKKYANVEKIQNDTLNGSSGAMMLSNISDNRLHHG